MKIKKLFFSKPVGTMGCVAHWSHINGYWRWALYWNSSIQGLGIYRTRSITGNIYPHFGFEIILPFGTLRLATQPPW